MGPRSQRQANAGQGSEGGREEKAKEKCTHGSGFSWMGRQHRKQIKLIAAWQMNTTRSASAYESTAALRSAGSNVGMIVVECLSIECVVETGPRVSETPRR